MNTTEPLSDNCSGHGLAPAESPGFVRTSLAGAITLGLKGGRFSRGARLGCLNLLLTYGEGCSARCSYCGLAASRSGPDTFIRVTWPVYPLEAVLDAARARGSGLRRVCVSMVNHSRAIEDAKAVVTAVKERTEWAVSALAAPTLIGSPSEIERLRASGADCLGLAVDAATRELFERHRGRGVGGPHNWEHYWRVVSWGVEVFGERRVSVHLIVGLGETECEMAEAVQRAWDAGAVPHLFSFFPERGSRLADRGQPTIGQYRRAQLARHLIAAGITRAERMAFDAAGRVIDFGAEIAPHLEDGAAFRTSGCPGPDGHVACNRPYGNERPGGVLYNYPFRPEEEDLEAVARQLWEGVDRP